MDVVHPAPTFGQHLGLSQRGEKLGFEKFISEPADEQIGIALLLQGSRHDMGRADADADADDIPTALEGVGNEFRTVVAVDLCRFRVEAR